MKKVIEAMRTWWSRQRAIVRQKSQQRKHAHLMEEAERSIQVREYAGKLWFSVNNMPILQAESLTSDFASAVASAREAWVAYCMSERTVVTPTPVNHG